MRRIARKSIEITSDIEVSINGNNVKVTGKLGEMNLAIHPAVNVTKNDNTISFSVADANKKEAKNFWMHAGTCRSNINNCVIGVSKGFTKRLNLVGVGYRAKIQGENLELFLGYSHSIKYNIPAGIKIEMPAKSQTEIIVSGCDKQKVGQVAAKIRAYRPPEPYKGKGVCYVGENIFRKEVKKK